MTIRWKKLSVRGDEDNTIMKIDDAGGITFVPLETPSTNKSYSEYKEWLDAGNTPEAAD